MKTASRLTAFAVLAAFTAACSSSPKQNEETQSLAPQEATAHVAEAIEAQTETGMEPVSAMSEGAESEASKVTKASKHKKSKASSSGKKKKKKSRPRA